MILYKISYSTCGDQSKKRLENVIKSLTINGFWGGERSIRNALPVDLLLQGLQDIFLKSEIWENIDYKPEIDKNQPLEITGLKDL